MKYYREATVPILVKQDQEPSMNWNSWEIGCSYSFRFLVNPNKTPTQGYRSSEKGENSISQGDQASVLKEVGLEG